MAGNGKLAMSEGKFVLVMQKLKNSIFRFNHPLLVMILLFSTPSYSSEKISLSCVWTVYSHMTESFLIDLEKKNVLWVEEEVFLDIADLTDGYIKFNGTKSSMKDTGGVSVQAVKVSFKINRINGRFDVISEKVITDRVGECLRGQIF